MLLHGAATVSGDRLELGATREFRSAGAWFQHKAFLEAGFTTAFAFQIPGGTREGFALVIQNNAVPLLGAGGKGMGYEGIANSVAVEFDARRNTEHPDPAAGHVSIHTRGMYANLASHDASMASTASGLPELTDGNVHVATIHYRPGRLQIFIDNTNAPRLELRCDLAKLIQLEAGQAWIGFVSDGALANAQILNWLFVPAQGPAVGLASPASNSVHAFGSAIALAATGAVSRVDFFDGSLFLASDTAPPFAFNWTNASPGNHWLTVAGYASDGRRSVSAPVKITVNPTQPAIGINFARGGGGINYPLGALQTAGVTPQTQWNNLVPTILAGNGSASNLRDANGAITPVAVEFQFNGPGEELGVDTALSPDHQMMRAYLANHALIFGQTTSFVKVTNIPFAAYDVLVYSESENRQYERVSEFRIGSESIFLRDQAHATFAGHYTEARGTANQGLNTTAGNYVRFRGLTGDNFTLDVFERSFADVPRRAAVNGIQIVPAAPASPTRLTQVVRGPFLQSGAADGMSICWRTDRPTNAKVRYGASPGNLNFTAIELQVQMDHAVRITGLTPDTRYYYALGASGTNFPASPEHYFVTSPRQTRPVRLWVIGDSGTADYSAASVRDAFLDYTRERKPDLMLMLGDNAYNNGSDSEYQAAVFDMFAPVLGQTVLWSCMGNHETYTIDMPYLKVFHFPTNGEAGGAPSGSELYYSFNYANIHFVGLESTVADTFPGAPMMNWLQADLAANTNQWLIVYVHAPPHSKGSHDSDEPHEIEMQRVREHILPVLENYGVDLILSGNSHGYERSFVMDGFYGTSDTFGPQYILQGGTGRPDDTGPYVKPNLGLAPHSGTISVIAGNGGVIRPDYGLNHPVMARSLPKLGSVLIDINGPNLDATLIRENGTVADYFSLRKGQSPGAFPQVSIAARASTLAESAPPTLAFDITRSGPTNEPLRVLYQLSGGAENGRDFARLPASATIPAGQQTVTVSLAPVNDTQVESPESLRLTLAANVAPFRLVLLPDTRAYIGQVNGGTAGMLEAQTRWIAAQADALNIAFVLHPGDVTENNSVAEWALAQTYLQLPIPLAIAPGDKDGLNSPVAQTALFNTYFPAAQARNRPEFGGVFESNKLDNAYYYFSGGGIDWLVLALESVPRDEVLQWANRVVAAHPQRKVIVLTHVFVGEDDTLPTMADYDRDNSPAAIWEKLLRRHANIAFVFSGDTEGDGLGRREDLGDYGNKVVQIASNFSGQLNGGNGYLRILEFDPAQDRLRVQTFSPYLSASRTDLENQFDVPNLGLFKPWHTRYAIHPVANSAAITIQDNDVDAVRPTVASVRAVGAANQIVITFSEPVNESDAQNVANYSLAGFVIGSATLQPDGRTVVLTLAGTMQDGASYSLAMSGIRDRALSPNVILSGTSASFAHRLAFLVENFDDPSFPGWQIVDEGTVNAPSIWRAPAGRLDQSSYIHGPDRFAIESRQGTYVYWGRPEAVAWNNYIVRATVRTPEDDSVGLLFWFQDSANYYKLELDRRNSFFRLLTMTSGFETLIAEESGTYPLNTDLQLAVEAVDDRIYATVNAQPLFGGIITNASSGLGTVGLYCWHNAGVTFDNVEVVPAPPNDPPMVSLTAPAQDFSFVAPGNVALSANAADADGIRQVEFFAGQELLGVANQGPPYALVWSNVPPGEYALTAVAKDNRGFSAVSTPVAIHALLLAQTFESGGIAGWTIRDEGSIEAPSSWQVTGGRLAQISNIYGPTSEATANRRGTFAVWDEPVAYRWRDYVLSATLSSGDDDGIGLLFRYRDANNYYKLEFDAQRNFRKLLRMLNGVETTLATEAGGYAVGVAFTVHVKVVDGRTEARMNDTLLFGGTVTDSALLIGTIAVYSWGNTAASFDNVRVSALSLPDQPPLVTMLSPANNSTFVPPASITFFAEASDADGMVQGVDFLAGDTLLGSVAAAPYIFIWQSPTVGTYSLRACATDNFGFRGFSARVEIVVNYPPDHLALSQPSVASPGILQFRIEAPLDTPIVIESSRDLQEWTPIGAVTNVSTYSQPIPANESRQFYRARRQQ